MPYIVLHVDHFYRVYWWVLSLSVRQIRGDKPLSLSAADDTKVETSNDATSSYMPCLRGLYWSSIHLYCVCTLPSDYPVMQSSSMIVGYGADDYHNHYGSVLVTNFELYHAYWCGNMNHSCDFRRLSIILDENCQCYCYCVCDHVSEHLQS